MEEKGPLGFVKGSKFVVSVHLFKNLDIIIESKERTQDLRYVEQKRTYKEKMPYKVSVAFKLYGLVGSNKKEERMEKKTVHGSTMVLRGFGLLNHRGNNY